MLKIDELNADNSTKLYLDETNMLLETYASLKKINQYKLKCKSKPWITLGLQKSISVKNKLLTNFIIKVGLSPYKKNIFVYFSESPLKIYDVTTYFS